MEPPTMEPKGPSPTPNGEIGHDRQGGIHLVIIGAGLAGLAAALSTKLANPAHKVTICEAVRELQEIGAGLQITPNGTRLLSHWGLAPSLSPLAAIPRSLSVHRYDGTKLLAHEPDLQSQALTRYGHPFWDLHRVDLQKSLLSRCRSLGVTLLLNSRVTSVDFDTPSVTLDSGHIIHGDVVLVADGLYSTIRSQFLGKPSPPIPTGDLAYRLTIHIDDIPKNHPHRDELITFIQNPTVNFWVGPHSHAVGYSVSSSPSPSSPTPIPKIYNIVLLTPSSLPPSISKLLTTPSQITHLFSTWSPILQKFISTLTHHPRQINKWNLLTLDLSTLPKWTNPSGTFLLSGDACHPMLPYLAQGANTALEDGAVLGHLLSKVTSPSQLPKMGEMYSRLRRDRCVRVQEESVKQRGDFHLVDGEEQEGRDGLMMGVLESGGDVKAPFPSRWTCPEVQEFLWGYDAYGEAEGAWVNDPF